MHWGLIPNWAKDPTIGNRMINARVESLTEKPAFRQLVQTRRCIIPADGFYEWRKEGKRKIPMWVHLKSREPFGLAGLWDVWRNTTGKRVESFTIITTEPNELISKIHHRMAVILKPYDEAAWIDPKSKTDDLLGLLRPYESDDLEAFPVSRAVNSPAHDSPACIAPAEPMN